MPLAGKELTPLEVARLCYKHGIDPDAGGGHPFVNAIAVCFAESAFYAGAWNFTTGTGDKSYGLWQINMLGAIGPERRLRYKLANNEALYSPDVNCQIMVDMSKRGTNFKPWGAFTTGSYRRALGRAHLARADLLRELKRPVKPVSIPIKPMLSVDRRPWVSVKQITAAAMKPSGVYKLPSGDTSRDDVANYQLALWALMPNLPYKYNLGVYDAQTKKATAEFQRRQKWSTASGIAGPLTVKLAASKSGLFRLRDV